MSDNLETDNNNTPKRVRIAKSTTVKGNTNKVKTPKALAIASVEGHVASLHPQVSKIILSYTNKLIDLFHKLKQKETQLTKMNENEDFIPRSARVNFEFYLRPEIRQTDEFGIIQSETIDLIKTFQYGLKAQVVKTMKLDVDFLKNKLNIVTCELIYYTSKAFHFFYNPTTINPSVTNTVAFLIYNFGDNLLKHCSLDKHSFKQKYTEVFHDVSIQTLYTSTVATNNSQISNASNPLNRYARNMTSPTQLNFTQDSQPNNVRINVSEASNFIDYLRQTLECVLVVPLENYLNQVHTNKASSQLEAFSTEILYERATAETAHQMELSQSVTPQELEELITKSTSKAVASLSKEIQSLKSKLANATKSSNNNKNHDNSKTKNQPRGAQSRASSKTNPPITIRQSHDRQLLPTEVVPVLQDLNAKTVQEIETKVLQTTKPSSQTTPTGATLQGNEDPPTPTRDETRTNKNKNQDLLRFYS